MHGKIRQLIDNAVSADNDLSQRAIFILCMVLEKNSKAVVSILPETSLEREMFALRLNVNEQGKIIRLLIEKAKQGLLSPSLPCVIGAAKPQAALGPLLRLIEDRWDAVDDETRWQLLVALRDQLVYGANERPLPALLGEVRKHNPFQKIESAAASAHVQLADIAGRLVPSVQHYLAGKSRGE